MRKEATGKTVMIAAVLTALIAFASSARADVKQDVVSLVAGETQSQTSPFYSPSVKNITGFVGTESINVELLAKLINAHINEFEMLALKGAVEKIKKKSGTIDLASADVLDTLAKELFTEPRSQMSTDKIVKAFARYATTVAFDSLISAETYSSAQLQDKNNLKSKKCRRDLVRVVLSEFANRPSHPTVYWSVPGGPKKWVNFFSELDFPVKSDGDVCADIDGGNYYKVDKKDRGNVEDQVSAIMQLAGMIAWLRDHYSETSYDNVQQVISTNFPGNEIIVKTIIPQLVIVYDAHKANDDKKAFEAVRTLISTSADLLFDKTCHVGNENCLGAETACTSDDKKEKNKCELYKNIALSVMDNVTYDDTNKKLNFSVGETIKPIARQFNQLGYDGQSGYFFHFVIGSGMTYVKSGVAPRESNWMPLVNEQIGFGYRLWISDNEKSVGKIGLYTSGLLYRALFNNAESKGVIVGPFFAVDLYKSIQVNISPFVNFVPAENDTRSRSDYGISFGLYIPLGDYIGDILTSDSKK